MNAAPADRTPSPGARPLARLASLSDALATLHRWRPRVRSRGIHGLTVAPSHDPETREPLGKLAPVPEPLADAAKVAGPGILAVMWQASRNMRALAASGVAPFADVDARDEDGEPLAPYPLDVWPFFDAWAPNTLAGLYAAWAWAVAGVDPVLNPDGITGPMQLAPALGIGDTLSAETFAYALAQGSPGPSAEETAARLTHAARLFMGGDGERLVFLLSGHNMSRARPRPELAAVPPPPPEASLSLVRAGMPEGMPIPADPYPASGDRAPVATPAPRTPAHL